MTTLPVHPGADAVLDALDPEQREVAAHPSGPMCVLAGAGTGKTRTITHRIAYQALTGAAPANQGLAVTHSRKAAQRAARTAERAGRARASRPCTFHAAALRQLSHFCPLTGLACKSRVRTIHSHCCTRARAPRSRRSRHVHPSKVESESVLTMDARDHVGARPRLVSPKDSHAAAAAAAGRVPTELDAQALFLAEAYQAYENLKRTRGVLDFDDILVVTVSIVREPRGRRRGPRPVPDFVVDEYQDIDRPSRPCWSRGWATRTSAWSATRRRPSSHLRAPARAPAGVPRPAARRPHRGARPQLPLHPAGGPPTGRAAPAARAARLGPVARATPPGRPPSCSSPTRTPTRPPPSPPNRRPRRPASPSRSRCCSGPTPRPGPSSRVRRRGVAYLVRGDELLHRREVRAAIC